MSKTPPENIDTRIPLSRHRTEYFDVRKGQIFTVGKRRFMVSQLFQDPQVNGGEVSAVLSEFAADDTSMRALKSAKMGNINDQLVRQMSNEAVPISRLDEIYEEEITEDIMGKSMPADTKKAA